MPREDEERVVDADREAEHLCEGGPRAATPTFLDRMAALAAGLAAALDAFFRSPSACRTRAPAPSATPPHRARSR